jgi:glycerol-3-phosphate dehydrogenase
MHLRKHHYSLLQSKIKDAHEKGEPYAQLYAYSTDGENALNVIDAVECWFRYATEEEAATIPPELQQRRRGLGRRRSRRPARAAASTDRTATEEEGVDSPAATSKASSRLSHGSDKAFVNED